MATIKFILQSSNSKEQSIYLRLSLNKNTSLKRKSGYVIHKTNWFPKKGEPKDTSPELKNLKTSLDRLKLHVTTKLNQATNEHEIINGEWLQSIIDNFHGKLKPNDNNYLVNYAQIYIDKLPTKVRSDGSIGASLATEKKCKTVKRRIIEFEKYSKKKYLVSDVNTKFASDFTDFLRHEMKLGLNTVGNYIKCVKTFCNDARKNGHEVSYQVESIKGFKEKTIKTTFNQDEIDLLENKPMPFDYLDNARNWLVLGCNIGQRVRDLLKLTTKNLTISANVLMVELIQQKTKKRVAIPINEQAKRILDKNEGNFPRAISDQRFNDYIKQVCKISGMTQKIQGSKINPKTRRKEVNMYEKWELITSHICRRSFATNYYGIIPTAYLKDITAHSSEKQFLEYVGKPANESAFQVAKYMANLSAARNNPESNLKVV